MLRGDQKGRGCHPIISEVCEHTSSCLRTGIHLGKMCLHVGRDLDRPGIPKKWDNWSEENEDPEELPCVSDLNHLYGILLLIREDAHSLSLQVYTSALLLSQITNDFPVCFSICCAVLIIMNFVLFFFFQFLPPWNILAFKRGQEPGQLLASSPWWASS